MMKTDQSPPEILSDPENTLTGLLSQKLNYWLSAFEHHLRIDSNGYAADAYHRHEMLAGCGAEALFSLESSDREGLDRLRDFLTCHRGDFIMGHISFEGKDLFEVAHTSVPAYIPVPMITFFVPQYVIRLKDDKIEMLKSPVSEEELIREIDRLPVPTEISSEPGKGYFAIDRHQYIETVSQLIRHIRLGDIYEVNFCQAFHIEGLTQDPYALYERMQDASAPPFGALYRIQDLFLCSASPERFIAKRGGKLICQPIKGTNRRLRDPEENKIQQLALRNSQKERSENVMIVDLMRNDLSRICYPGTVKVEELFGVYAFRHVNQMISTVVGEADVNISFADVMKALFPMGSMTGAPKIRALELIDQYEAYQRGLFSGTVGYIDPVGDWDFNVVIRSLVYDRSSGRASISSGGAITALSDPSQEYEESLLKMESLRKLLGLM